MYCWEGGGWRDDGITMDGYMNCKGGLREEWMRGQMGGQERRGEEKAESHVVQSHVTSGLVMCSHAV